MSTVSPVVTLRNVIVDGRRVDVRVAAGRIEAIGSRLDVGGSWIDGRGGALVPGLHDHHLHLLATAAAESSVPCGPPAVKDRAELGQALRGVPGQGWVRGVGYHESVAGGLDREALDDLIDNRPVRVQHRSGALWVLNSAALDLLGPGGPADGRLFRQDEWLRERLDDAVPSLSRLGHRLASRGVTGVTDASPGDAGALATACQALPQHLISLGDTTHTHLTTGPRKIVIDDHKLPSFASLCSTIGESHAIGRSVALHSVTRDSLLLLLAALDDVGALPGDRIEHAAVAPPEAVQSIARLGVRVVTQPTLIALRGDAYLDDVDPDDVPHLWRHASLLRCGVPVGLSSDAPYGDVDPWAAIAAAHDRRTRSGRILGESERVSAVTALESFLSDGGDPGGPARRLQVGTAADLVLLTTSLSDTLTDPASTKVRLTLIDGRTVYDVDAATTVHPTAFPWRLGETDQAGR